MKRNWVLKLLPSMMSFGPVCMVLFANKSGEFTAASIVAAFTVVFALFLLDGMIRFLGKRIDYQAAMIDDLRKIIAADHPEIG